MAGWTDTALDAARPALCRTRERAFANPRAIAYSTSDAPPFRAAVALG